MGLTDPVSTWVPTQRQDPGPDGRLGTSDDGPMLDVFNLTSTGPMSSYYTNPSGAYNKYDALQVVARKRFARDWQAQASYTLSRTRGTVGNTRHVNAGGIGLGRPGNFIDPNQNINAYGRAQFDPTHEVKVLASYRVAPWGGTMISGVYRYTTGQAWGRMVLLTGLNQGPQRVRVEPVGTRRAPAINQFDFRIEKTPGRSGFQPAQSGRSILRCAVRHPECLARSAPAEGGSTGVTAYCLVTVTSNGTAR